MAMCGQKFFKSKPDDVDLYVESVLQKQKVPGISIAVIKKGRVIKAKGYGLANVEHKVPATSETIYQSGSIGKQFTAALIMLLAKDGKLKLDDKISLYLKEVPIGWKNISIRHLLTHTSGITDYYDAEVFNYRLDYTEEEILTKITALPLQFEPGEQWSYSNSGYLLLGYIIKNITGKFYGEALKSYIFEPLKMKTARIINEADIIQNRASGYRLVAGELKNQEYVSPSLNTHADGALYLSVLDLAQWDAGLYSNKLFSADELGTMWSPVKLKDGTSYPYGFGWFIEELNNQKVVEHTGAWQGFEANISRYIDDKLTVVVFSNLSEFKLDLVAHNIAGILNPFLQVSRSNKCNGDTIQIKFIPDFIGC